MNGFEINATGFDPGATYILYNSTGNSICQGNISDGNIQCQVTISGIYFLTVIERDGSTCVQKVFVKE